MDCETGQKFVKKKSVKKHKTSKRKKKNDSSGDEAVDLSEKIFPIVHYINDREEMMKQVFSVMEKEKLNCMLPPILKGMTVSLLKENCLKELRNMSDDEIRKVLCGECIETSNVKVSAPSRIDSDSSGSSVEECHNAEQEKRTLLDILEQEMQEIAYSTVLKRDDKSHETQSDDGLEEVIAITPINSPSKAMNNVPLIFIDSEDEEPTALPSEPLVAAEKCVALNNIIVDKDNASPTVSKTKATVSVSSINATDNQEAAGFGSQNNNRPCSKTPTETGSKKPQENFVIRVFSSKSSVAERVVEKIYKSSAHRKDLDKDLSVNKKDQSVDSVVSDSRGLVGNKMKLTNESNKALNQEVAVVEASEEVVCLEENPQSLCQSSSKPLDPACDTTAMTPLVETCTGLNGSNMPADGKMDDQNVAESLQPKEKEEGEITEGESEEESEVLQAVQGEYKSPTIFLSSDSDVKSDVEKPESRDKGHKHHHRHRRSKRNTESPERSRRHIDKRGNRSYRRKASSSVKENINCAGKEEEISERNNRHSKDASPEVVNIAASLDDHVETQSAAKDSEDSSKLEIEEKTEIENIQAASSPNTLEIDISDTKLDSSEEAEISNVGEPISTKTSWADRWAEKKDMKKVVITSKICRNVRKRILSARRKQSNQESDSTPTPVLPPVPPLVLHVEGSVQEYQMLQLLVSDDDQHAKSNKKSEDICNEESSPISESVACDEKSQVNSVKEADTLDE